MFDFIALNVQLTYVYSTIQMYCSNPMHAKHM